MSIIGSIEEDDEPFEDELELNEEDEQHDGEFGMEETYNSPYPDSTPMMIPFNILRL